MGLLAGFGFVLFYSVLGIPIARLADRFNRRNIVAVALAFWSAMTVFCGMAQSVTTLALARIGVGISESGGTPASQSIIADLFSKNERPRALGIYAIGTYLGVFLGYFIGGYVNQYYGWRMAFISTGVFSLIWLVAWIAIYRRPREQARLSATELAYIESDPADPPQKIGWFKLLGYRETWAYALGKFLIDPIWWLFLFWTPDFLAKTYHLDLKNFGPPLVAIYLISDIGSVAGGWSSSTLMKRGYSANAARKLTMLVCAFLVMPIFFAQYAASVWLAVGIVGLATAAHQAFSANLYTIPSDMFPRAAVGSVIGIGGTVGAIGGMGMAKFTGYILQTTHSYTLIFAVAGSVYLIAIGVVHLLSPKLARVDVPA